MVCELFLNKALTEKVLRSYQSIKKPNVVLHGESLLRVPVVLGSGTSCGKGPGLPAGARSRCVRALGRQGLPGRHSPGGAAQCPHTSEGKLVRRTLLGVSRESRPRPPAPAAPLLGSLWQKLPLRAPPRGASPPPRPRPTGTAAPASCSFPSSALTLPRKASASLGNLCRVPHCTAAASRRGPSRVTAASPAPRVRDARFRGGAALDHVPAAAGALAGVRELEWETSYIFISTTFCKG